MIPNKKLIQLVIKHPTLPIMPFIYWEVCADAGGWWQGRVTDCWVDEWLVWDGKYYFKSEGYLQADYEAEYWQQFSDMQSDKQRQDCIDEIFAGKWQKAIMVFIGVPERDKQ